MLDNKIDESILKEIHKLDFKKFLNNVMHSPPLCVVSKDMVARARQNVKSYIFLYQLIEVGFTAFKSPPIENVAMCVKSHNMNHCKFPCEIKKVSWLNKPIWYRDPFFVEGIPVNQFTDMIHNKLIEAGYNPSKYGENYFYPSITFKNYGE